MVAHDHEHEGGSTRQHATGAHVHLTSSYGRVFAIAVVLNLAYVGAEAFFGIVSHSLALLADAGHNLSDVLGLLAAWIASVLSQRRPGGRYTYGLRGSTILAALANAVALLVVTGGIGWEAIRRLQSPEPLAEVTVVVVASIGVVINGAIALMFMSGRKGDLNIRGVFLHMGADALVTLGVVVAGAMILWTGWIWLDPAISLIIGIVIVVGTWRLLRESVNLALGAVPPGIDHEAVAAYLSSLPGITAVHDLHIWGMSTTETALTAHLVRPEGDVSDALLMRAAHELQLRFGIGHTTLQVETGIEAEVCWLAPEEVV